MWRLAHCVYRAFRNSATYYCSQDVLIPFSTICSTDDSQLHLRENCSTVKKCDIQSIVKHCEFTFKNIEKLQDFLKNLSIQLLPQKSNDIQQIESKQPESSGQNVQSILPVTNNIAEPIDSSVEHDETLMDSLITLSNLHEETMSLVNLQLAVEELESGNFELGIQSLETSIKTKPNAAAFYNLGICYENGIGVEKDRAKACDYYRQAASLGHINAQLSLTLLSNNIDIDESDQEIIEETSAEKPKLPIHERFFRFSLASTYKEDDSWSDHQVDLKNQTVACLSLS